MNRVGHAGPRREHVARLLPARRADATSRRSASARRRRRAADALPRRGAAAWRRSSSWPGTASGTGAATTTTARRWARRRTTSAGSTRSRSRGRCSPAPCRSASPSARWTPSAPRSIARGSQLLLLLDPPFDRSAQDPGYIKGVSAGRPRERRPVHARRGVGRDGAGAAGQRRRSGGAVPHAQPDQPHADAGRRRALQGRALRRRRRRLRAPAARRPRRLELVHGLGGLDVSRRPREHPRACAAGARPSPSTPASRRRGREYAIAWRFGDDALRDRGQNPERRVPRRRAAPTLDGAPVDPRRHPAGRRRRSHEVRVVLGGPGGLVDRRQ